MDILERQIKALRRYRTSEINRSNSEKDAYLKKQTQIEELEKSIEHEHKNIKLRFEKAINDYHNAKKYLIDSGMEEYWSSDYSVNSDRNTVDSADVEFSEYIKILISQSAKLITLIDKLIRFREERSKFRNNLKKVFQFILVLSVFGVLLYFVINSFQSGKETPTSTGEKVEATPTAPSTVVSKISWSPDGNYLAIASANNAVGSNNFLITIRDINNQSSKVYQTTSSAFDIAWSPIDNKIAYTNGVGKIGIISIDVKEEISLDGPIGSNRKLYWSLDGERLTAFGESRNSYQPLVSTWDTTDWNKIKDVNIQTSDEKIIDSSFSLDGNQLATQDENGTISIWSANDGTLILERSLNLKIPNIAWAQDNIRIAFIKNHLIYIWDLSIDSISFDRNLSIDTPISSIAWSPNNINLAIGLDDGRLIIYNSIRNENFETEIRQERAINFLAWSPDGSRIASDNSYNTVQISELNSSIFESSTSPPVVTDNVRQTPPPTPIPALLDDFSDGLDNNIWKIEFGTYRIEDDSLTTDNDLFMILGDNSWSDYVVEVEVTTATCGTVRGNFVSVRLDNDDMLALCFDSCGWAYLWQSGDGVWTRVKQHSGIAENNTIKVVVNGDNFEASFGGNQVLSYQTDLMFGKVGLKITQGTQIQSIRISFPPPSTLKLIPPNQIIREYFGYINNQEYDNAWSMLSPMYKDTYNSTGFNPYVDWWEQFDEIRILGIDNENIDSRNASIEVELSYFFKDGRVDTYDLMEFELILDNNTNNWQVNSQDLIRENQ